MSAIRESFRQGIEQLGLDPSLVELIEKDDIVILEGQVDQWQQVVDIGHMVAKLPGVDNLVNHQIDCRLGSSRNQ